MAVVSVYNDTDVEQKESKHASRQSSIDLNQTHDLCQINVGGTLIKLTQENQNQIIERKSPTGHHHQNQTQREKVVNGQCEVFLLCLNW